MKTTNATGQTETKWVYSPQRGFLLSKIYADNTHTDYTYTVGGRLKTRTWARGITTSYGYNNAVDLSSTDYSDSTPDVMIIE